MTDMRPLRSLLLVIVALAAAAALWLSLAVPRHRDDRLDPLGATLMPASAAGPLLVDSLRSGGAAEQAGLRVGDRIVAVDGRAARSRRDVARALRSHRPVILHVRRAGRSFALKITSHRS
ncbi:S1-C subfamily serine protease [Sphingomonas naasensis]|uniref:PDZ domain-containing protein n=1 Tax=Sphingomonas naasensis TaxID=1344951 RepID=A0A4V3QW82_9SPHN|nr:PDZ domain-containing protein [Sphingomonas naasensis]NIJ21527.1 S1-C subfamily serine protease [Sphingomonas naasensis]TGX41522.1 PDZ domain-containing protein [Sphingomonas naasensis]